jgi:membrane-associated phospholipid phosphatase
MLRHEAIGLLFFAHIAVAAVVRRRMPAGRRAAAGIGAVVAAAAIVAIAQAGRSAVREWAPVAYILAAYYLAGRTFFQPMPRVESWLADLDRRILGNPSTAFRGWPAIVRSLLDIAYIGCFLVVPAGLLLLAGAGHRDQAEHYWTLVMGAELGAFATLPYLQTRPPWVLERLDERDGRASVSFMKHATTHANTLPSGHAAGSLAVGLAVVEALPAAGMALLALAIVISVSAVVTRAHYVVDVVTGAALAGAVWWLARAFGW